MYSRDYRGKTIDFEASGGLKNASLVLQDQQTDTYWSIMEGEALAGELRGEKLVELPVSQKIQWRQWKQRYPDTLVLSVDGKEDAPDSYRSYFREPTGFRGAAATDTRLDTKTPIFAFHHGGAAYAARQKDAENGNVFELGDGASVLLFRRKGSSMFQSTFAFVSSSGFEQKGGTWIESGSGAELDRTSGAFPGVVRLEGFDTFWYTFSLNNPNTTLLE